MMKLEWWQVVLGVGVALVVAQAAQPSPCPPGQIRSNNGTGPCFQPMGA